MIEGDRVGVYERRRAPRVMVSVPMRMFARDRRLLLHARSVDLSAQGAMIHGIGAVQVGQQVDVEVQRGAERNPLRLRAEVVRIATPTPARRQHGVAVRFTEVNDLDAAVLEAIIAEALAEFGALRD